jgi:hypothetical protein
MTKPKVLPKTSKKSLSFMPISKIKLSINGVQFLDIPTENLDGVVLTPRTNRVMNKSGITLKDLIPESIREVQDKNPHLTKKLVILKKEKRDERKKSLFYFH